MIPLQLLRGFFVFFDQISAFLPLERLTLEKYNCGHIFQELWFPLLSELENFSRGDN